jgi:hypothetical protein
MNLLPPALSRQAETKKYDRQWVAVLDKRVIDSDKNLQTLVTRLRKKLSKGYPEATIDYVTKQSIIWFLMDFQTWPRSGRPPRRELVFFSYG